MNDTDKTAPPVRVELHAEWNGGSSTETYEYDRAEWEAMTPKQRMDMLSSDAQEHLYSSGAGCGYSILDDDEGGDVEPAEEPVEPSGPSELEQYAADLMLEHARGVESLSVFEMADEHLGRPITDDEAEDVLALINRAEVVVGFRDQDTAG